MSDRKRLQVWLDEIEFGFIQSYAKQNHLMVSELIRGWIHEVMKREGFVIKEPSLPEPSNTKKGVNKNG
ncbi:MAG TPA: hypothetical protein VLG45_10395 [Thermodesulfobacteriota bacterium]|nr:hypothetical protein [Thermodesulfobacteriota bacterium]